MALKADYEFLFVGRDDNSFLENYSYDLFQDHGEKSGQIFVNIEVQNNPVDAEEIGEMVFETMQKVFFEDVGKDDYERFEASLKAINGVLKEFKSQKNSGYIGNLNMIIAAIVGENLYLSQTGDSEAYLIRKRFVSVVSEGLSEEGDNVDDIFSNIANGKVEAGDFVLFSSTRLLRYISKNDLARSIHRSDVGESLDEIKDVITTEMLGRVGLTGIMFSHAKVTEVEDMMNEGDHEVVTNLEADASHVSGGKRSITGKFLTALKDRGENKGSVYKGPKKRGLFTAMGDWFNGMKSKKGSGGGESEKNAKKGRILTALVVVIVLLIVGIFVARSGSVKRAELEELDTILLDVQTKIAQAETTGTYDKEGAKIILDKAYEDAMGVLNSGYYRKKAEIFLIQIEDTRDLLDNVNRIESPTVLADLSEKRTDINALGFVELGDRVFVYEYNAFYEIVLDQVQDPITIDDDESVIAATGFDDRDSIIFLTKSGNLIEYRDGTISFMDTADGTFRKGVAIDDWSNRIYLLDATDSQIWKYSFSGNREQFSAGEAYVADETIDLTAAIDLAIDGSVYVLSSNSELERFYGGTESEITISDAPLNAFDDSKALYTSEKLDEVYVLDAKDKRVFAFFKDETNGSLVYKAQYLFEGVDELRDIYVDADSRKMYVLTPSKVLEIPVE